MPHLKDDVEDEDPSPGCDYCGQEHLGMRERAYLVLEGAFHYDLQNQTIIFVPHPDTKFAVRELPNGALGFLVDVEEPTRALHYECYHDLAQDLGRAWEDDEDEEDD